MTDEEPKPVDPEQAIKNMLRAALLREVAARKAVTDLISAGKYVDPMRVKTMVKEQGNAIPWRIVERMVHAVKGSTYLQAVVAHRATCVSQLVEYDDARSTCRVTDEFDHMERAGRRRFLRDTTAVVATNPPTPVDKKDDAG